MVTRYAEDFVQPWFLFPVFNKVHNMRRKVFSYIGLDYVLSGADGLVRLAQPTCRGLSVKRWRRAEIKHMMGWFTSRHGWIVNSLNVHRIRRNVCHRGTIYLLEVVSLCQQYVLRLDSLIPTGPSHVWSRAVLHGFGDANRCRILDLSKRVCETECFTVSKVCVKVCVVPCVSPGNIGFLYLCVTRLALSKYTCCPLATVL